MSDYDEDQYEEQGQGEGQETSGGPTSSDAMSTSSDLDPIEVIEVEEAHSALGPAHIGAGDAINEIDGVQVVSSRRVWWIPTTLFFLALVLSGFAAVYFTLGARYRAKLLGHILLPNGDEAVLLSPYCNATACRYYSKALEASLNRSKHPCEDFYSFVCDGWTKHTRYSAVEEVAKDKTYKHILQAALRVKDRRAGNATLKEKVAALIKSCLNTGKGLKGLQKFMTERHLPWPRRSTVDLVEVLVELSANWGVHLWFQVVVIDKTGDRSKPAIEFRHSGTLRTWMVLSRTLTQNGQYDAYISKVLRMFGVRARRVPQFVKHIKTMDRLITSILGPATSDHSVEVHTMTVEELANLTPGIPMLRWVLVFNDCLLWIRRFNRNTLVRVEGGGFLRAVAVLLTFEHEVVEALSLSLGFNVIHEIGWMADRELGLLSLSVLRFPETVAERRCLVQVEKMVGPAWFSLLPPIQDLQSFLAHIVRFLEQQVWPLSLPTLNFLDVVGNSSQVVLVDAFPELQETFFSSWIAYHHLKQTHRHYDTVVPTPVSSSTRPTVILQRGALYERYRHEPVVDVLVGREFLIFPLYYTELPKAIIYAGAGRLIADEIIRAYGVEVKEVSHRSTKFFQSMEFDEEAPTETRGLIAAFRAYQSLSETSTPSDVVVFPNQLFFLASCYALCTNQAGIASRYGSPSERCNRPLRHLPEFALAFRCDERLESKVAINYTTSVTEQTEPEVEALLMRDIDLL